MHEIDTGYYHGMFGFVGADGELRPAKYSFSVFCKQMENKKMNEDARFPMQQERMEVLYK